MNESDLKEKLMASLAKDLPAVVSRKTLSFKLGGMVGHRTLANMDSQKRGIEHKIKLGRTVGYPRESILEWVDRNMEVLICESGQVGKRE